MGRKKITILVATLLVVGSATWMLWPEPEPEPFEDKDTGLSRDETEEMMRSIGYVQ